MARESFKLEVDSFCFATDSLFCFFVGRIKSIGTREITMAAGGDSIPILQALEREFRQMEEADPSVQDGFKIIYDREVPFELRPADSHEQDVGALEGIKVKVLTAGEENSITALRVELSSETDLFFHYTCVVNHIGFQQLREDQKLMCDFRDFAITLLKTLNKCIREPQTFLAVLLIGQDGSANLEFIQNMEYKFIDLLVLPFRESAEGLVRQHITYRYNAIRSRLSIMTARLQDVSALVKLKGPNQPTQH